MIRLAFINTEIRLTAVGDTKQRIMGWAGALEGIFLTYASDFKSKNLNLYRNFRSLPNLIRMQNEIIKVMDASAAVPDNEIKGEGGKIEHLVFANSSLEAKFLVDRIQEWIETDGVPHSEIAILVSKQADLYAELLMKELEGRGIPFRNEQKLQDISTEPASRLIIDFLSVLFGHREPDAYVRLMELLVDSGFEEDDQIDLRTNWQQYLREKRLEVYTSGEAIQNITDIWTIVLGFLRKFGRDRIVSLSAEYEQGNRLNDVVSETKAKISELIEGNIDIAEALLRFSDDRAVRIMTIHKSKGLEFHSVIILGIEKQTFWGELSAERCAFFVGVSRAKRHLLLTRVLERTAPTKAPRRWDVQRQVHDEFMGYTAKFTDEVFVEEG